MTAQVPALPALRYQPALRRSEFQGKTIKKVWGHMNIARYNRDGERARISTQSKAIIDAPPRLLSIIRPWSISAAIFSSTRVFPRQAKLRVQVAISRNWAT